jgi:hypothetical protein
VYGIILHVRNVACNTYSCSLLGIYRLTYYKYVVSKCEVRLPIAVGVARAVRCVRRFGSVMVIGSVLLLERSTV